MNNNKPEINISSWLDSVTNLPLIWQLIIEEVLTNRCGIFKYNYDGAKSKKNKDEIIYSKPFHIDLTITIDEICTDEEAKLIHENSNNHLQKTIIANEILNLFEQHFNNDSITPIETIHKIKNYLENLENNSEKLEELFSQAKEGTIYKKVK